MVSEKGKYLVSLLQAIKSPLITDIRGSGLMVGMDLAIDPAEFVERCRDYNLLVITAGTKTIRIVPPLTITFEELKSGVDIMTRVLKEMSSKARL
jgi:acetylornithine/succinyldiaminopimelate/putrescine aminotransferase